MKVIVFCFSEMKKKYECSEAIAGGLAWCRCSTFIVTLTTSFSLCHGLQIASMGFSNVDLGAIGCEVFRTTNGKTIERKRVLTHAWVWGF